jgi:hypothetical protein
MTVVLFLPLKLIICLAPGFFVCMVYERAGTYLPMNKDTLYIKSYVPIVFLLTEVSGYESRKVILIYPSQTTASY